MVQVTDLWLAILIASACVFIASAIIWMVLPYHKTDIKMLPDEAAFKAAIIPLDLPPGLYMYPNCQDSSEMKSDEFKARWKAGPWGTINVLSAQPNFPINLLKTFIAFLVITVLVAYLTGVGLGPGAELLTVFRVAGTAALLGHCTGGLAGSFFLGKPTRFVVTDLIDGVIFAIITAGILALMWPGSP